MWRTDNLNANQSVNEVEHKFNQQRSEVLVKVLEICILYNFHLLGGITFLAFPLVFEIVLSMIEVICNDRLGKKVRVKCNEDDTIGDLKKLIAAQVGTRPEKIRIQKWYTIYKDHITLQDYEIHDGMGLELYYN